jgi:hypothetical protein
MCIILSVVAKALPGVAIGYRLSAISYQSNFVLTDVPTGRHAAGFRELWQAATLSKVLKVLNFSGTGTTSIFTCTFIGAAG